MEKMEGEEDATEKGLLLVNDEEINANTTPLLFFSTFIIVSASFTYGAAMGYTADTMHSIMTDLDLSLAQFSLFGSLSTFGGMFGSIFSAKAAAAFGYKMTLWLADLFCITGWLAIALAKDIIWLDMGRILVGIGVGLVSYVIPVYVAEITPKHVRGAFTFSNQLMQNFGIAIVYYFGNFVSWRTLALIGSIPCWIQVIGLFFIPESPRWLAKNDRDKEVEVVLQKLRGPNYDIVPEACEIKISVEASKRRSNISIRTLFKKKYAHQLTIGIGLMVLQQLCGSAGIGGYGTTIFNHAGFPARIGMMVLSFIVVPKSFMGLLLVDRWGRRPLLMASGSGLCMSCITLAVAFIVKDDPELGKITPILCFIGILSFTMMFAIGMGALPWIIMSEIFPMDIKVLAGSLVTITNWFTGWIANYCFNFMFFWSQTGTFIISAAVCGGTVVFTWWLVPETRGLTLEEIQQSFGNV
ncbi:PREDICTED: sugar transporter ERD6-like 12 isoform X1 [Camelina sativa]|uniref:Sugar transporter ERD6-like 12 isoform X1 n=2 Tax=Camelina sativa TaxID=90675 RepID=A0ABM0XH99_CAMSA|nr:PREDICTED: sugar transporter ERD6-like 12 isoform X1 [Camelina sativa]